MNRIGAVPVTVLALGFHVPRPLGNSAGGVWGVPSVDGVPAAGGAPQPVGGGATPPVTGDGENVPGEELYGSNPVVGAEVAGGAAGGGDDGAGVVAAGGVPKRAGGVPGGVVGAGTWATVVAGEGKRTRT